MSNSQSQPDEERDAVEQSATDADTAVDAEPATEPKAEGDAKPPAATDGAGAADAATPDADTDETQATQSEEAASTKATKQSEAPGASGEAACRERIPATTREQVVADAGYRCQTCGRRGPEAGGLATLHVHHIERDPEDVGVHDPANLTVLCRACHHWHHQRATPADAPVELSEADRSQLLPQDIEILRVLAQDGPARTGDIAAAVATDVTVATVRERLWVLMGLDNRVAARDQQLVDKDVETNEWGLVDQIETSARGHVPDDPQLLLQRMEDEQVRQALDRGCDRRTVAEVLGITRRTTFNKEKRARAYGFPAEAYSNRGGRPTSTETGAGSEPETDTDATRTQQSAGRRDGDADAAAAASDAQQRLDAVGGDVSDAVATSSAADGDTDTGAATDVDIEAEVRAAIAALESVANTL